MTARSSSGERRPAITCGAGRTPITAVLAAFIWLPWVMLTLTRTSWRALPRGLTQTVIGNPVVRGNRFAISKRSSGSSASAPSEPICLDFTTLLPLSLTVCIPIGAKSNPPVPRKDGRGCKACIGKLLAKRVTLSPAHPSPKERTMHYKRISADCHLDMPCMPPELFVENASREMKERMPYVEEGPDGPQWVAKNGANFGLVNGVGPGGAKHVPGQNVRVDIMAEQGLYSDANKGK